MDRVANDIVASGLVAIIRAGRGADVIETARSLSRGGVKALEVTLNTPGALKAIERLRAELSGATRVGAGTILCAADARAAIDAGAEFIVTPTLQADTIAHCRARAVPVVCGCASPAEAMAAHAAGAQFIKLFPAHRFGLPFIRAVREVMPALRLVPTGGVSLDNVSTFFEAGCPAVAVGSHLVDPKLIAGCAWDALADRARRFVAAVARARGRHA